MTGGMHMTDETEKAKSPPKVIHVPSVLNSETVPDEEDGNDDGDEIELHCYVLVLKDGLPPLRVWDTENIDDVSQRLRSEKGRKGLVRFPAKDRLFTSKGEDEDPIPLPVSSVEASLIGVVQEVFEIEDYDDEDDEDDDDDDDAPMGGITLRRRALAAT